MRAIIQAGGKGTRLAPYTHILPKPLMPIADESILEIVIRQLAYFGFDHITVTLGHLGHLIQVVIGDGSQYGVKVDYVTEDKPLGTVGALSLVEGLDEPFLTMNGDLLTDLDYRAFFESHVAGDASLTIGMYRKKVPISLGVFELDATDTIIGFREKPVYEYPCSMGIYVFDPSILSMIPKDEFYGFDSLMYECLEKKISMKASLHDGIWLDIGRPEDYAQAARTFEENRSRLLPDERGR